MPIIIPADLATHIYPEVLNEITREDESITIRAIDAAIQEAKLYLSRFDLIALFGTPDTPATVNDALLQRLLKDIAAWHIIRLSNTGIDNAACRTAYEDAIKVLKNIMEGKAIPDGWPYLSTAATTAPPDGTTITWSSNPRRTNHY